MFNVNYNETATRLMAEYPTLNWVDFGMGVYCAHDVVDGKTVERIIKPVDGTQGCVPWLTAKWVKGVTA